MMVWVTWSLWALVVLGLTGFLLWALTGTQETLFLPGLTTAGHYQIELNCNECHGTSADGLLGTVRQDACLKCHEEELDRVGDSHPVAKFAKPTDAVLLAPFDKTFSAKMVQTDFCVTCHAEHDPQLTRPMGLTQPEDYCQACHADIAEERPTHIGLGFTTCLTAGCHNFHDNSALFEAYLTEHRNDDDFKPDAEAVRPMRDFAARYVKEQQEKGKAVVALTRVDMDAPKDVQVSEEHLVAWETTAHAKAGVNCSDCHLPDHDAGLSVWDDVPTLEVCRSCHKEEAHGFLGSRHGMRIDAGLDPMRPDLARLPMKASSDGREMNCNACHGGHAFDTTFAAADACMQCHDDPHTRNYTNSIHAQLWRDEVAGEAPAGSGVSCATCHLPRVVHTEGSREWVQVQHNQNDFLRPNEKMIRPVCTTCHGVPFAIDALADAALTEANFDAPPRGPHFEPSSFELIEQKLDRLRKEGRLDE